MPKKIFYIKAPQNGYILSQIYLKSELPKKTPNFDIIRITAHNGKKKFIDCFVYPQEAVWIASALMSAYVKTCFQRKDKLGPRNTKKR